MFPGPCHQSLVWFVHFWWWWAMLRMSLEQHTACVVWFMDHYFREATVFFFILKRDFKKQTKVGKILSVFWKQDSQTDVYIYSVTIQMDRKCLVVMAVKCAVSQMKKKYRKKVLSCQLLHYGSSCWIWVLLSWNFNSKSFRPHFLSLAIFASCNLPVFCLQSSSPWEASAFSALVFYWGVFSVLNG